MTVTPRAENAASCSARRLSSGSIRERTPLTLLEIDGREYYLTGAPMETLGWAVLSVVEKSVTREDRVELGADRYPLDWKMVDKAIPKIVDVRKLKEVWEEYNKSTKAITQSTQRFQVIRSIVPVFTMSAVLIGYLSGGRGGAFYLIYLLVIGLTLFFSFKAWRDIAKNDARKEQVKDTFTRDYCCPGCGYFFGFTDFRILSKNMDKCPKCKAKLLK